MFVVDGARQERVPGLVGDLQQRREPGQTRQDVGERRREARVIHQRRRLGVVEQVEQLVFDVAVVDVERRDARLVRAEHALEVLVAVVEVETEVILARLPVAQRRALDPAAESAAAKIVREPPRAIGERAPGETAVAKDDALAIWDLRGDRFLNRGEVEARVAWSGGGVDAHGLRGRAP